MRRKVLPSFVRHEKAKPTGTWINILASRSILVGAITLTAVLIHGLSQGVSITALADLASMGFISRTIGLRLRARAIFEG